ncbi:hypothetical protein LX97_03028 [Nonlabens dokdonensis]|uniref:DUF4870 domain-containing protein n=2 Tax=Nonlabens dokdonensis TaxID=328515 RepID=L7W8Y4_NONDD|nr:hypothetical protein [Nonlabens dokdonensis]AGC78175.1 hypothetical protein DDD_3048 [Nonlabens dokdonensis DSW-6]PZX37932.1 hypothetical protein LX97_03028 [Nonlabens dokdonensis]
MSKNPAGKNLALLAYGSAILIYLPLLFFIGAFGVAIILNQNKGNKFASFHIRQMFGIGAMTIIASIFTNRVENIWVGLTVLSLMVLLALLGFTSAYRNQQDELPFIGKYFQQWFTFIK